MNSNRTQDRATSGLSSLFENQTPVIPFLTAGFPTRKVFLDAARAVCEAGAGALEIGMPFSDPLADGPAIQYSSQVALDNGIDLDTVLALTDRLHQTFSIPIFLMGYLNPILRMGLERFAARAADCGAAGTIIPDCPVDEAKPWIEASRKAKLANTFLIAPTTPEERIALIDRRSTAFSYCVSVSGVTGARKDIAESTRRYLRRVKRLTHKPYVVGFGIAKPRHIRDLKGLAYGFVVGSALVRDLTESPRSRAAAKVGQTITALVKAAQ